MLRTITVTAAFLLLFPSLLLAVPTQVVHEDVPNCDPLFVPDLVDELGLPGVFPIDELIEAFDQETTLVACPSDDEALPNVLVTMTNLSPTAWSDVWYVADPFDGVGGVGTSISNFDGFVDGFAAAFVPGEAFKIDTVGINRPLIFESMTLDGIFEIGETWQFIIDDYFNTGGLAASLFDSVGVASFSAGGPPSSGSIIAIPVPEPSSVVVAALGFVGLIAFGWRRRKR